MGVVPALCYRMGTALQFGSLSLLSPARFWWLFEESLQFLFAWPMLLVTVMLLANLCAATIFSRSFRSKSWKGEYWLTLLSLLFIRVTSAIGTAGRGPGWLTRPKPNEMLMWANHGLDGISVALCFFWVDRMKGLRWFALSFSLVQLWILLGAGLMTGMALTGDRL